MKFLYFIYFAISISGLSCTDNSVQKNKPVNYSDTTGIVKSKPGSSFSDTIKINFKAAVFYNPDSLQLIQIRSITSMDIFESTMHDCFYQMRNATIVLNKFYPQIKIINSTNARYLQFEKASGEKEIIDLNTKNDSCGIIIFDGKKSPLLTDMTNIESDLGFYFSK